MWNGERFSALGLESRLGLVAFLLASGQWLDRADEVSCDFRRAREKAQALALRSSQAAN